MKKQDFSWLFSETVFEKVEAMTSYPRARVPTQPVLSVKSFTGFGKRHVPSVLDSGAAKFVTSGRVAIALALQQMNVGKDAEVLVPAYHCPAMVEPVIWSGATPVFYKINADTSVNLEDIKAKLNASSKVLMAANYFGFPQDLSALREFCDTNGLKLLEDCAHSFFGQHKGKPLGSFGDYAIGSSMKFFPVYEGGCLISSRNSLKKLKLNSAGLGFEAKSAFNALERSFEYQHLRFLKVILTVPTTLKNFIWGRIKSRSSSENYNLGPGASDGGFGFEEKWLNKRCSWFSRFLISTVARTRIANRRRENYLLLEEAVKDIPGCRPLFPELYQGVFPWVFPVITNNTQAIFDELKNAGVPVVRFGEFLWPCIDSTVCENSVNLSRCVLQFPCHQELRHDELNWMISMIKTALLKTELQKVEML